MKQTEYDVVVIGAGVIGHSTAFRLKRTQPRLAVAVLGDPVNSLMASRAAAGMLAPFGECSEADRFFEFCRQSLDMFPAFIDELVSVSGTPVHLSMRGSLMPSFMFEGAWDERKRFFREQNIPHEVWPQQTVRERAPYLSERCGEVLWVGEGQVNNRQMHDALAQAAERLGIDVLGQNVTGFLKNGTCLEGVRTDSGAVRGQKFLLASGSWSKELGDVLGVSMPLKPIKGQMCRVKAEPNRLPYTVHGLLTYIAPWQEGQGFVLGSTMEDRGFDASVEADVIQKLIDNAAAILPCIREAPLIESWTGLRPAAEDLMPVMGKSARYPNLYYSTGHFRNGILQTPNQAEYMAGVILESGQQEIPEFSPGRYDL